jgi:hypothetical protein
MLHGGTEQTAETQCKKRDVRAVLSVGIVRGTSEGVVTKLITSHRWSFSASCRSRGCTASAQCLLESIQYIL